MASSSPFGSPNGQPAPTAAPQYYRAPTPQELRAQAVHRLQIGILGLAAMLLLVSLADIIMDRVRVTEQAGQTGAVAPAPPGSAPPASAAADDPASDPLADIGVVPDLPDAEAPAPAVRPSAAVSGPAAAPAIR